MKTIKVLLHNNAECLGLVSFIADASTAENFRRAVHGELGKFEERFTLEADEIALEDGRNFRHREYLHRCEIYGWSEARGVSVGASLNSLLDEFCSGIAS